MNTQTKNSAKTNVNSKNEKNVMDEILNSKNLMNDENLLNLDLENLDSVNLDLLIKEVSKNTKQKTESKRESLYKISVDKKIRQQIRKKRDLHITNVLFLKSQNNSIELKKEIDLFNKFYKETYSLNDYSENSIMQNNSDNETKIKVRLFLTVVKNEMTTKKRTSKKQTYIKDISKESEIKNSETETK